MARKLIRIYECLCNETRLRILNLLVRGPLCVCHIQEILEVPQVKASRHLAYLRKRGLVEAVRHEAWRIYRLPVVVDSCWERQMACLQDCAREEAVFARDLRKREELQARIDELCGCVREEVGER